MILNLALGVTCILVQPKGGIYNLLVKLTRLKSLLPVDLYLIFGKSSLKNQVWKTACVVCTKSVQNRLRNQFDELGFSKINYISTRVSWTIWILNSKGPCSYGCPYFGFNPLWLNFFKCSGKFMKGWKFLNYQNLISSTIEKIIQQRIILGDIIWKCYLYAMLFLKGHYKLNRIWVSFVSTIAIICHNRFCKTIAWSIVT